jgi:hypothetical protein
MTAAHAEAEAHLAKLTVDEASVEKVVRDTPDVASVLHYWCRAEPFQPLRRLPHDQARRDRNASWPEGLTRTCCAMPADYALANMGHNIRALQAYIQHTVRYTELSPT